MEQNRHTISDRVRSKGFAALALAAIIVASGVVYIYATTPSTVTSPTGKTPSLRYDEVLFDNFEDGSINPGGWNVTGPWMLSEGPRYSSPYDGCYQGKYCVWSGNIQNIDSQMVLNLSRSRSWVNYTSLLLSFSLWVDTNSRDVLYVDYFNSGNWNVAAQYSGLLSITKPLNQTLNGWILPQLTLPTTTTMMRFRYSTGCCEILYRGIFIDEVGVYMVGPGSFGSVLVSGWDSNSAALSVPVSMDNAPYTKAFAGSGFNCGVTFLASPANHTLTVPSVFSDGSKSYAFVFWSGGPNSVSKTVSVQTGGNLQLAVHYVLKT